MGYWPVNGPTDLARIAGVVRVSAPGRQVRGGSPWRRLAAYGMVTRRWPRVAVS
jgi:hypothetical protein